MSTQMEIEEEDIGSPENLIDDIVNLKSERCDYVELGQVEELVVNEFRFCALHINIHSALAKLDDLKDIICTMNEKNIRIHFILLCETF